MTMQPMFFQHIHLQISNNFTYEFWTKPISPIKIHKETLKGCSNRLGQGYIIFPGHGGIASQVGTGISVGINGICVFEHTINHLPAVLVYKYPITDWSHIALVYTDKTPQLYINGQPKKKGLKSLMPRVLASGIIGAPNELDNNFTGEIEELRIWNHVRTSNQINHYMNKIIQHEESGLILEYPKKNTILLTHNKNNIHEQENKTRITTPCDEIENNIEFFYKLNILDRKQVNIPLKKKVSKTKLDFSTDEYLSDVLMIWDSSWGYRPDYWELLYPIANELSDRGRKVAIYTNKNSLNSQLLSKKVEIIFDKGTDPLVKDKVSRIYSNNFLPEIENWSNKLLLNTTQKRMLERFFFSYLTTKHSTIQLLNMVKPKCVYSIHYIMSPGRLGAYNSFRLPLINILIQHGFFGVLDNKYHDFIGADLVLLWGEYHQEILKKLNNPPNSVILGNPKLEILKDKYNKQLRLRKNKAHKINLLYILSLPPQNTNAKENLDLFLRAIKSLKINKVTYKLHPSNTLKQFNDYVEAGLISPDQLSKQNIYQLIQESQIVIGDYSTAIFEAAALQKPTIQICSPGQNKSHIKVTSAETDFELANYIIKLLNNSSYYQEILNQQNETLKTLFYNIEGSTKRIADYLDKLLECE